MLDDSGPMSNVKVSSLCFVKNGMSIARFCEFGNWVCWGNALTFWVKNESSESVKSHNRTIGTIGLASRISLKITWWVSESPPANTTEVHERWRRPVDDWLEVARPMSRNGCSRLLRAKEAVDPSHQWHHNHAHAETISSSRLSSKVSHMSKCECLL